MAQQLSELQPDDKTQFATLDFSPARSTSIIHDHLGLAVGMPFLKGECRADLPPPRSPFMQRKADAQK